MKLAIALAAIFISSAAYGQSLTCRPLDKGNVYIFPGEQIVQTETGRQACKIVAPVVSKPAAAPAMPNADTGSIIPKKCLVVEIQKRAPLPHLKDPERIYRDSINLDKKEIRSKYNEGQIQKLLRNGVHVVVINSDQTVTAADVCR